MQIRTVALTSVLLGAISDWSFLQPCCGACPGLETPDSGQEALPGLSTVGRVLPGRAQSQRDFFASAPGFYPGDTGYASGTTAGRSRRFRQSLRQALPGETRRPAPRPPCQTCPVQPPG